MNFQDISYLKLGNSKQIKLYNSIKQNNILEGLKDFNPILVSTICVNLDLAESDVDIICESENFELFADISEKSLKKLNNFKLSSRSLVSFEADGFLYEIYCSKIPTVKQNGFIHFAVMHKILEIGGEKLRDKIMKFKKMGYKTEPAIAKVLNLNGDPFEEVSKLNELSDVELRRIVDNKI